MNPELDPIFETNNQECFEKAIKSAEAAVYDLLGVEVEDYSIVYSDDENAIGFPAVIKSDEKKLYVHLDSFESFVEEYTSRYPDISYLDLAKVHITGALVPSAIAQVVKPRDKVAITKLLDHMTSIDSLKEQVNNSDIQVGLDIFDILSLSLLTKSDDDIGKINSLRLSIGALTHGESLTSAVRTNRREQVDFGNRVVGAFRNGFYELPSDLERYKETAKKIFRQDVDIAERDFIEQISPLEIAAAFPMEVSELSLIAGYIHKNK